jgi:hypothetical protein
MRLWSVHPRYLDAKGLVALWREGLLARSVLKRKTQGYRYHPQLDRFRSCLKPIAAIDRYLWAVYDESEKRGFHFDARKLGRKIECTKIWVTRGQLQYEWNHLKAKLKVRDRAQYARIRAVSKPLPHPLFRNRSGGIEPWERIGEHGIRAARNRLRATRD